MYWLWEKFYKWYLSGCSSIGRAAAKSSAMLVRSQPPTLIGDNMILYTVKFKRTWVQLTGVSDTHPDGTGWTLTNKFNRDNRQPNWVNTTANHLGARTGFLRGAIRLRWISEDGWWAGGTSENVGVQWKPLSFKTQTRPICLICWSWRSLANRRCGRTMTFGRRSRRVRGSRCWATCTTNSTTSSAAGCKSRALVA